MNEQLENFLNTLSKDRQIVFRSISKDWIATTINKDVALSDKNNNIYFLWWVMKWAQRLTDHDIDLINYIRLDIDIKKQTTIMMWVEPTTEELLWFIDDIKEIIDKDPYFSEYSFIVYSWWWCHIYYSNIKWIEINSEFTPKMWQLAMKRIYKQFNVLMGDYEYLFTDTAVCNTARVMRLPWSVNQKNWQVAKILYDNNTKQSRLFNFINKFWIDELNKLNQITEIRKQEIEDARQKLLSEWKGDTDFKYEIINKLPAYLIAQILIPQFPFDWKKNFRNNEWWFTWYYYIEETNAIANGGSRYFNWGDIESSWNNFSLVKRQLWLDSADTFKFFEEKFNLL